MLICIRGAKDICAAIGENPKEMRTLVEQHELPAWRRDGRGAWRALPEDLHRWLAEQRDRNLGRHPKPVLQGVCGSDRNAARDWPEDRPRGRVQGQMEGRMENRMEGRMDDRMDEDPGPTAPKVRSA